MKLTNEWVRLMWAELDGMTTEEQIVACGEWISYMTRVLLPQLGLRRRSEILAALARPGWDTRRLAESIGTRATTISRLAEEGRAARRQRQEPAEVPVEEEIAPQ